MSVQLQLYLVAALDILVPVFFLILFRRAHKYRVSSIICGIAAYFLVTQILISMINTVFTLVGLDAAFWEGKPLLTEIVNVVLNAVLQTGVLYLLMRFALKKKISVYDSIVLGLSYWLGSAMMLAISAVSYGQVSYMYEHGRLQEMVSEALPLSELEKYAQELSQNGASSFFIQLFGIYVLMLVSATICLFLYLAIKQNKLYYLWICMGAYFAALLCLNLSMFYGGNLAYIIANVVMALISLVVFLKFFAWYRERQLALLEKKQAYKESLKEPKES